MNVKTLVIASALLASAAGAFAGDNPLTVFEQANAAYAREQYRQAIGLYESLAARGETNAALYYNLGNAYFKDQRIGKAIVNLERAERLAPRDQDVRFNLRYLRAMVKEPPLPFFEAAVHRINGLVSLNELLGATSFFFVLCVALLIGFLLRRGGWLALGAALAFLALVAGAGWLGVKMKQETGTRWAIVVAGTVEARNGPGTDNSVAFSVPEGRKIMVLGENGDWYAVGLPHEGITGWVEKQSVEPVGA